MKKLFCIFISLLFCITSVFCEKKTLIDYQGAAMGAGIPSWVINTVNRNQRRIHNQLSNKGLTKYWIFEESGSDLDMLKDTCSSDLVFQKLYKNITDAANDVLSWNINLTEAEKTIAQEILLGVLNPITLNGLEFTDSYWVKFKNSENNEEYYVYYSLLTMPKYIYDKQIYYLANYIEEQMQSKNLNPEGIADLRTAIIKAIQ